IGIDRNGPLCNCGKRGCIEALASGTAIGRRARQKVSEDPKSILLEMADGDPQRVTSEMVAKAHAANDPVAREVMRETVDMLAYWLGNVIDLLEPIRQHVHCFPHHFSGNGRSEEHTSELQ